MTPADGGAVRIKIKGRVSPDLADSFGPLDVHDEPRHTVIIASSDHLVSLLQALDGRGVVVDRIKPLD
jgi:hypothetical protein